MFKMLKRMLIIALCSLCIRCNYVNKQLDSEIVCRKNDFQYITQKEKGEISNSLFENVYKGLEYLIADNIYYGGGLVEEVFGLWEVEK